MFQMHASNDSYRNRTFNLHRGKPSTNEAASIVRLGIETSVRSARVGRGCLGMLTSTCQRCTEPASPGSPAMECMCACMFPDYGR